MTYELGKPIYASQLRYVGNSRGTYLRMQIEDSFVWYEATDDGFKVTHDAVANTLEKEFQNLFDEQVKDFLQ